MIVQQCLENVPSDFFKVRSGNKTDDWQRQSILSYRKAPQRRIINATCAYMQHVLCKTLTHPNNETHPSFLLCRANGPNVQHSPLTSSCQRCGSPAEPKANTATHAKSWGWTCLEIGVSASLTFRPVDHRTLQLLLFFNFFSLLMLLVVSCCLPSLHLKKIG